MGRTRRSVLTLEHPGSAAELPWRERSTPRRLAHPRASFVPEHLIQIEECRFSGRIVAEVDSRKRGEHRHRHDRQHTDLRRPRVSCRAFRPTYVRSGICIGDGTLCTCSSRFDAWLANSPPVCPAASLDRREGLIGCTTGPTTPEPVRLWEPRAVTLCLSVYMARRHAGACRPKPFGPSLAFSQ